MAVRSRLIYLLCFQEFAEAKKQMPDLEQYLGKTGDDMNPQVVHALFSRIPVEVLL